MSNTWEHRWDYRYMGVYDLPSAMAIKHSYCIAVDTFKLDFGAPVFAGPIRLFDINEYSVIYYILLFGAAPEKCMIGLECIWNHHQWHCHPKEFEHISVHLCIYIYISINRISIIFNPLTHSHLISYPTN